MRLAKFAPAQDIQYLREGNKATRNLTVFAGSGIVSIFHVLAGQIPLEQFLAVGNLYLHSPRIASVHLAALPIHLPARVTAGTKKHY